MSKESKIAKSAKAAKAAKVVNPIYKTQKSFISVRGNHFGGIRLTKTYNRGKVILRLISKIIGIRICLKKLK
jgi:hypothetical protein